MDDCFESIESHFDSRLFSKVQLNRLHQLARRIPTFSSHGFECRLGEGDWRVDFGASLQCLVPRFFPSLLEHSVWKALDSFCRQWVEPTSGLHRNLLNMLLEFDMDGSACEVPIPSLFLTPSFDNRNQGESVFDLIHRFPGIKFSEEVVKGVRNSLDVLPEGARVLHVGLMLSRPTDAIRLVISGLPSDRLAVYLRRIGWNESLEFLDEVRRLSEMADRHGVLSIDVGKELFPRIGMEFFLLKQPAVEPRWGTLLEYLVDRGWCTPAKREALLNWPGFSITRQPLDARAEGLDVFEKFLRAGTQEVVWRSLSHIKLCYSPEHPMEAKAYIEFGHRRVASRNFTLRA